MNKVEFTFVGDKVDFEEAKSFCVQNGAKLFEPRDANILKNVIDQAKTQEIGNFWLGIHDIAQEGTFVYASDNTAIEFDDWAYGEPNNVGKKEDCAVVGSNGKWNDLPCTGQKRSIVCAKELGKSNLDWFVDRLFIQIFNTA